MKIIVVCKKEFIPPNFSFSFRKGVEYNGYDLDYYIQIKDDKNQPYYFNDDNFDIYFYNKKELRKEKLEKIKNA